MMNQPIRILSWNIQSGRGCDGVIDIQRISDYLKQQGELDVICLQEIARYFPEYTAAGQRDQLQALIEAFPDHTPVWGAALSWPGETEDTRREFGNLTLTRLPLLDSRVHVLPGIAADSVGNELRTPRCAVETLLECGGAPLRILNTHLAFHDRAERMGQLDYLNRVHQVARIEQERQSARAAGIFAAPFITGRTLICGDLNLDSRSDHYGWISEQGWRDAWRSLSPESDHAPTCGIFDSAQWPEGPHCRDYFWLQNVDALDLYVDTATDLSDHQPLILTLEP
ncbi:endonuclease/exonuclease/phosphatase family protein [Marinobacterium mangrovicola]|uniref:Endonuclease/exonuclease/phosphatase family metal-dependent hydrolase n=1 Tax=Marinobacterium mangrovicola TaxID=1476959 RepID=A0A4V2PCU1_9GAMM|nr:endonuclease/exonuclease/phosphatase family protein [Marinobacterium mangrovicola]TCK02606.1 endonuclease/exonuclease/phosphatase family metal-dependent hydrolase [Marinobacterium mangrovicola]